MTFGRVARLDTEARKVFAVRLVRDSVRNRMAGQCSGVEGCLDASLIESKVVLDGSKVKLRDPESILRELKISWMFVESQQQAFYKFGTSHDVVMSTCACCGIAGHERHSGLWFIWPLGGSDENSIVVSGSVRTTKEVIQRQEDAAVTLDIEFSVEHPLFAWMVTDKSQEFLGRSLYRFGVLHEYVTPLCEERRAAKRESATSSNYAREPSCESGQRRHRQLLGRLLWLKRSDFDSLRRAVAEQFAVNLVHLNLRELKTALALMTECEKVHLEYSSKRLETSSGKHGHLIHMCPSEPDEECKEIHHVWVKGSAEITWYPVYATSKEEVVTQMRENISKERSLEQHLSVLLSTCEGMSDRALIDERARWILQEVTVESLMNTAEAILTETAFHRLEGYASDSGSFVVRGWCDDKLVELTAFVADYTQARKKQLDFLESLQVYEKVYVDVLTSGTRVMFGQDERDPCLFVNAEMDVCRCALHDIVNFFAVEWGQASDWREAWNRVWNQSEFQVYFAERTSVV